MKKHGAPRADVPGWQQLIEKLSEKPDYSSPSGRRSMVDHTFAKAFGEFEIDDDGGFRYDEMRRKKAVLFFLDEAVRRFGKLELYSVEESFAVFESQCLSSYGTIDDEENYTLAAALWILEELRRTGKLHEAYSYLPDSMMKVEDVYIPIDFYHPCYEQDLIQSVAYVISDRNAGGETAKEFQGLMNLLNRERVKEAAERFKQLQWDVIGRFMKAEEYYDRKSMSMMRELRNLVTPNALLVNRREGVEFEAQKLEDALEILQDERRLFGLTLASYLGADHKRILESRELGRIMEGFCIDDPYEVCFALTYLRGTGDEAAWLMKASASVLKAACSLLPWHENEEMSDEELEALYEGMPFDRGNGWLDTRVKEPVDYYHSQGGKPNLAQCIFRLCRGVVPTGLHPFQAERESMKAAGEEHADLIADWADILFLSSFKARAANLERGWYDQGDDEDEEGEGEEPQEPEQEKKTIEGLGGYWGKVAEAQGEQVRQTGPGRSAKSPEKTEKAKPQDEDLARQLEQAKREMKSLKKALSILQHDTDAELARTAHELKTLRMEHRELADLRELVFNTQNAEPAAEKITEKITYPYATKKRTIVFGGHESFLKVIKPMLPTVRFVDVENYAFNPELVKNADVVWVQNNRISHTQYWNILKITRQQGIQLRYFAYSSAEKCAEQLVMADRR